MVLVVCYVPCQRKLSEWGDLCIDLLHQESRGLFKEDAMERSKGKERSSGHCMYFLLLL